MMDGALLEDFGQRVDLTRRIREVLVNYPEGTTVLKELIQNADDAGATKVCLCLDRRTHGTESLLSDKLAEWQGPALLAYNDAVFTEDDFASISRVGDSKKQGQAWKTGRFGVGFNSVYHLTDLPSFVSGKYVVMFDPQGSYLPNISASNPGKRLDYSSISAMSLYKDQFYPYCAFGCNMKQAFHGTLFRLPLRNAKQAAVSKLSRQIYLDADISSLFSQLYEEVNLVMIFLKNILAIEMYVWDFGMADPQKIYSCSVNSADKSIIWHRQAILRLSNLTRSMNIEMDSFHLVLSSEKFVGAHSENKISTFFILQAMASPLSKISEFASAAAREYDVHLLPWGSIAACITDGLSEDDVLKQGRAFCFLPLPVRTGLKVHVNGYFEISSNRRSVWYGDDMDRGGKLRSDWNRLMLEDVLAPLYGEFLLRLGKELGPNQMYYSLWPSGAFEEPWDNLVAHVYQYICQFPVLYCELGKGSWIPPVEAFIHDSLFPQSNDLYAALLLLGMPVVHLPKMVIEMLSQHLENFKRRMVNPVTVRDFLRNSKLMAENLNRDSKLLLLEYCLSDLIDADVGKYADGLSLIPLANGEFGTFGYSRSTTYYICRELEYQLVEPIYDRIVDRSIHLFLYDKLSAIARSSGSNIAVFDIHCFLHFLSNFFPADWQYKDKVSWNADSGYGKVEMSRFMLFWQYIQHYCPNLSVLDDWPIFPSTSGHLYKASKFSKLINTEMLPDSLKGLLIKIGCKILDPYFRVDHQELSCYVDRADGAGVIDAIFDTVSSNSNIQLLFDDVTEDEKNELCQFLLDSKWYYGGIIDGSHINKCQKLPIYRTYGGGLTHSMHFSNLEIPRKFLPPMDIPEYFLNGEFVCTSSHAEEEILQRFYGIVQMKKTTFYRTYVLNRIHDLAPEIRDPIMLNILRDLPQLCLDDPSFKEFLMALEFVPTISGSLRSPPSLYDPRVDELYHLLEGSDYFPYGLFGESSAVDMLLSLGLRTSVLCSTIILSAREIECLMHQDQLKAHSRSKALLSYLEVNAAKWLYEPTNEGQGKVNKLLTRVALPIRPYGFPTKSDMAKFWNDLRLISWCPVLVTAPYADLPWPTVSSMVAPPKLVRQQSDMWLVSASMRILDGECSSSALSSCLGWSSAPSGNVIAAQLLELGKNNEIITDQVLRQELTMAMPRMYALLMSLIGLDEMDLVKAVLEGCRWIWVGDGFATVDEVVLDGHLYLAPYIRVIPIDLAVFKELFLELGVREFLKPVDYASIISRMSKRKGSTPLSGQELRTSILILQHLAEQPSQDLKLEIYLPDALCRLFLAKELVYNDAPWLLDPECGAYGDATKVESSEKINTYKFVHRNISSDVAERLGVSSLRRLLLAESSDSLNLSLSGVAEAFGQHEALTTRLKHIVEMYADGPGILFELVQNAEDAGASEVAFLLDKTQYGTSSTLSPEMSEWQGPALYCYNNSVFSSQDLYAISRIGQDSKLEKPFSIGRFGLGFNCVYHFTDVPSFVSGENIVIFDPHACHLPGISPSHPGLRIRFVGRKILEQFPDQFTPFLQFGCDLQHSYPGTLFRFPLRSEVTASRSHIKKEKYTPEDVDSLFHSFCKVASESLLFLRKIDKISIFVKYGADDKVQLIHCASRCNISQTEKEPHAMLTFLHGNPKSSITKEQFFNKLGKTMDKDMPWNCQKIAVVEKTPFSEMSHVWLISECLGGGRAKSKSFSDNKLHNFIPWACVAAYLHTIDIKDGDCSTLKELIHNHCTSGQSPANPQLNRKEFAGRAFCFLPLPVHTGLPAHVNAYFELSANRRDIWFGNDMAGGGKIRSDWNLCLLEDIVPFAYAHLLESITSEFGPCDMFFSFWPTSVGLEPWETMVQRLYKCITDLGLCVLYTKARGGQWISTKQAIFPDFEFPKEIELSEALSHVGLPLISFPKAIIQRFRDACPSLHFLNPHLLRSLLVRRKRGFENNGAMITVLEYCLCDLKEPASYHDLCGLPLLPLANGSYTVFSRRGEGERIFISAQNECDLLRDSFEHRIVDSQLSEAVLKKLHEIALSGLLNLFILTCQSLLEFLPMLLPAEWQHAPVVHWIPGEPGQPSRVWMKLLWKFLESSCDDLSMFHRWPILPIKTGSLVQLIKNSNVIKDEGWSENMSSLLQKIGCFLQSVDLQVDHPQLKNYVHDASAMGILDALQAVAGSSKDILRLFVSISEGERHEFRNFLFQSKWFSPNKMQPCHLDMIKLLPIFESYRNRQIVSLTNPTKWLKPEGAFEDILDESFVRTESEGEKHILELHLGIREPSKAEFYAEHVLKHLPDFLSQPAVLSSIFLDVNILIEEDVYLKAALSEIPFVLVANGSWQCPSRLYDPRVPGLKKLLHKESFFPDDKFSSTETLEVLVKLGLRRSLGFSGLLDSARSVLILYNSGDVASFRYGRRLLYCLDAAALKLSGIAEENQWAGTNFLLLEPESDTIAEDLGYRTNDDNCSELDLNELACIGDLIHNEGEDEFWAEMKTIAWCPVYINPPVQGLPWLNSGQQVASPNTTRPKSQIWMVSSSMHIIDGECCSAYIQNKLGWMNPPDIRILSYQLAELSKSYSDMKLCHDYKALDAELQREIPRLYSKLQVFIGTNDFSILKNAVDGIPWVWIGDNFISSMALAFDSPVKYHPYIYVVPCEMSDYRDLLLELGVKSTFDIADFMRVVQNLQLDLNGSPLSTDQLNFVRRVLESIADCLADKPPPNDFANSVLMPDSSGNLLHIVDLVYNDAPWMDNNHPVAKHFVHPSIPEDLAKRFGVQSLRFLSFVDDKMVMQLPCMSHAQICDLLASYGDSECLLFDLIELADCCKATEVHIIYDKREHPRQSLLQHNLGEYQGPSVIAVLKGATLSREEMCTLQFPPPWNLKGTVMNYGLGLLGCHSICDLLTVLSSGYLYMFDPLGLALAPQSTNNSSAKMFSLIGTNLTTRFRDQFHPLLTNEDFSLPSSDSTVIRMPLSPKCMNESEFDLRRLKQIFDRFVSNASSTLLFLKSVLKVSLSTWEKDSLKPNLDFSISIDPSYSTIRNPFSTKKWRKFHISRLFGGSSAVIKLNEIDLQVFQGGIYATEKWLTALSLGSGQTRNMALDRQYLAYNLTPVAGVAVRICQNGKPIDADSSSCILAPLPLSGDISIPVTIMGCFLVCHDSGRYIFSRHDDTTYACVDSRYKLIEAWNRELMACVRDSYIELTLELQKLRRDPLISSFESNSAYVLGPVLRAYGDRIYSFWPKSNKKSFSYCNDGASAKTNVRAAEADWLCLVQQVIRPFYERLVELPVWQLYHGDAVKANEGMFLCQSECEAGDNLPPPRVCNFIREHYPVFSVPSELVYEIQAIGVKVREIKPKMVRDLLKSSPSVLLRSMDTYVDVLDYCLSDVPLQLMSDLNTDGVSKENTSLDHIYTQYQNTHSHRDSRPSSSSHNAERSRHITHSVSGQGNDALEIMSNFGKALYDFGRGVVEDIGKAGSTENAAENMLSSTQFCSLVVLDFKGMPFPTATMTLARLGISELWVGTKEQQLLMHGLGDMFVHPQCLERPVLGEFLSNQYVQSNLKLQPFSAYLLSVNLRLVFSKNWINYVMISEKGPWVTWERSICSPGEIPSTEWLQLFWKIFKNLNGDLSLVCDWPLIPSFLNRRVLCRVKHHDVVFIAPISEANHSYINSEGGEVMDSFKNNISETELMKLFSDSYEMIKSGYPWLFLFLARCSIPVYDMSFLDRGAPSVCFPKPGQTLGRSIAGKIFSAKRAGLFSDPEPFPDEHRDKLFNLFATDFKSTNGSLYLREELDVLKELSIYKTTSGRYTNLYGNEHCLVSSTGFFRPSNEKCLVSLEDDDLFLRALGVPVIQDQDVLVRFALPDFERKTLEEQEDILIYIYVNWENLQSNSDILNRLRETNFVKNADDHCDQFLKPSDLLDPSDTLLSSVFSSESAKFPGERFTEDGWLHILRKVGLRTSTDADIIVECARKVELLGMEASKCVEVMDDLDFGFCASQNEISAELWSLGESVVSTILANFAVLFQNKFCDSLSKISFIPAEKGYPGTGGRMGGKRVLCSYDRAILLKDWPLAWSCAPILTKKNVIPPEYSWGAFHLRSPPTFSTVLKHLQMVGRNNGEDTLAHWPTSPGILSVEDASCEILRYLDNIWGSLSSADASELQKVPFVPVANGTRLVAVSSLFLRLTVNLSPFAFELPSCYLPYVKILKNIGMQDALTVGYAKELLINIQKSCGYQRLNPNELRAVMEILHLICDGSNHAKLDEFDWIPDAVVPDDGCRLVSAKSCVYIDAYGSKFLGNIDSSRLRFVHPDLPVNKCMALCIKRLSDVVVEEVDNEQGVMVVSDIGSVSVKCIREKLLSSSLQEAVWIIIDSLLAQMPYLERLTIEQVQNSLKSMAENLQFVKDIYTRYILQPKFINITRVNKNSRIPEWEGCVKHRAVYFVDRLKTCIYIAEPPSYLTVYEVVSIVVSQSLGMPVTLPVGSLFSCPHGSEKSIINALKLGPEHRDTQFAYNTSVFLGRELLPQDALQLQFHPLRPFYMGEIVAWRTGRDGEKLKYGKVPQNVRPSAGQALYRFAVETAFGETLQLLSSQVLSFRSFSTEDEASSSSLQNSQSGVKNHIQKQTMNSITKDAIQITDESQYGRVSAAELVQAVHDMLSAAGLNLDNEKKSLLEKTLTLQDRLEEAQVALLVEQEKADLAVKEADALKAAWSCRICLSAEVAATIIPCGHVLCIRCSSAVSRCPFCRSQVSKTIKIYRP